MKPHVTLHGPLSLLVVAATAVTAWPRSAHADDKGLSACIAANESSVQLRSQHKLLEARSKALECAADVCPALLRDACKHRVELANAALPTIVFDVKDAAGADVSVTVSMDGRPLDTPQGTAISSDPGEHKFVFQAAGQPPVEKTFILREGEKDRREPVSVGPAAPAIAAPGNAGAAPVGGATAPPAPAAADTGTGATAWSTQKTLALVAGGVGVAGIAVGSIFGWMAHSSWSSSQTACPSASNCPEHAQAVSDHDSATSSALVSTIAFAAAGAAIAGGAVLWFTAPRTESMAGATTGSLRVVPGAGPASAGVLLLGEF
jgi:hypothetical protein